MFRYLWIMLCILLLNVLVQAQVNTCDDLVDVALTETDDVCFTIKRNEICYGHNEVKAFNTDGEIVYELAEVGDVIDMVDITTIQTTELTPESNIWGIAMFRLQANVQGSIPGQPVTFLVFGDAELTQTALEEDAPTHGFILQSGIGTSDCGDLPSGGILFQSGGGPQQFNLTLNGVSISAGSTLYAQLTNNDTIQIALIEGIAEVIANEKIQSLAPNIGIEVSIDENGLANGAPENPAPFDTNTINDLVELLPGETTTVYCGVGDSQVTAPEGQIYADVSDGPHVAGYEGQFSFSAALEGQGLPAVTDVYLDGETIRQLFDVGVLREGTYTISHGGTVTGQITDANDVTWGDSSWDWACTLVVEDPDG